MKKFILLLLLNITSCSMFRTIGVNQIGPIFNDVTPGIESEYSWDTLEKTLPSNLKLVESLLYISPNNTSYLLALTKGYSSLAYGISETLYLSEKYKDIDDGPLKIRTLRMYSKAISYGLRLLREEGLEFKTLKLALNKKNGIKKLLNSHFSNNKNDVESVFFTAQAMAGLINLKREDMSLVSNLGIIKEMIDWSCSKDINISHGACYILLGAFYSGRPKMMGGNPAKGKRLFYIGMKKNINNWLIKVAYLENHAIPLEQKADYKRIKKELIRLKKLHEKRMIWNPRNKDKKNFIDPTVNIYQAIAIKRFDLIRKYEKDFF